MSSWITNALSETAAQWSILGQYGGFTIWHEGTIRIGRSIFQYWVKHYDEPSHFGIVNGRISKLMLKRNGRIVYNYDRGEDTKAIDSDTEKALAILIRDYN